MRFVKASGFVKLPQDKWEDMTSLGIIPINDVLLPFMYSDKKVQLLYGGRGGSKSTTIARKLIEKCRTEKYFKCYYGRAVYDRVRGSCHAELVTAIEEMHIEDEFVYSKAPNGTLTIIHIETQNSFFAFGGDNPKSMKGIKDPTYLWLDEFDQFLEIVFNQIMPTLRTIKAKTHLIGSLNNFDITTEHWIAKVFFPEVYTGSEELDYEVFDQKDIDKFLVNYTDNYFIDHIEYEATLKMSAAGDITYFKGMTRGEWGINKKGNEYYHSFNKDKFVRSVVRKPGFADHLSLDFNVMPYMPMVCCQIEQTDNEFNFNFYSEYTLKPPQNSTESVCKAFLAQHGNAVTSVLYYGDAQGTRRVEGQGDGYTRFDDLRKTLAKYISASSDRTTRKNQGVLKRRDLLNKIFNGDIKIGTKRVNIFFDAGMKETIKDFTDLKLGVDGKMKQVVRDEYGNSYQLLGHTSDAVEYLVCFILKDYL